MNTKGTGHTQNGAPLSDTAKVQHLTDTERILMYFHDHVGTTLDAAIDTGILRNCITWYVDDLERQGLLQAIYVRPDRTTGYPAKHYSADPKLWKRFPKHKQLSLFDDDEPHGLQCVGSVVSWIEKKLRKGN